MCRSTLLRWMFPLIAVLMLVTPADAAKAKYSITDLGKDITPTAINNHGQVVGYLSSADDHRQAIAYHRGRIRYLGTFGGSDSEAKAINDRGHIVGAFTANGDKHGFALYRHGYFVDLYSAAALIDASGINSEDVIIGEIRAPAPTNLTRQVVLYDHGVVTNLNALARQQGKTVPNWDTFARGINDRGDAVIFQVTCASVECELSTILSAGVFSSVLLFNAQDINDRGQVVGSGATGFEVSGAFLYEQGIKSRLADMGGSNTYPSALNNLGQVVGKGQKPQDPAFYPFIYHNGKMTDLNTLLAAHTKWTLNEATDINDRGQIIGTGTLRGQRHAFILNPTVQLIEIDVKPRDPENFVHLRPNSLLRVVAFGSSVFTAASIRPGSIRLTAEEIGLKGRGDRYLYRIKDINGDGFNDFISTVFIDQVAVPPSSPTQLLTLEAATFDGKRVEGVVSVRPVEP